MSFDASVKQSHAPFSPPTAKSMDPSRLMEAVAGICRNAEIVSCKLSKCKPWTPPERSATPPPDDDSRTIFVAINPKRYRYLLIRVAIRCGPQRISCHASKSLIRCAWVFATRRLVTTIEAHSCTMEGHLFLRHCLDRTLVPH